MKISSAISNAFSNLSKLSPRLYDLWLFKLYDDCTGEIIEEQWNEANLEAMETDVMLLCNSLSDCLPAATLEALLDDLEELAEV